MFKITLKEIRNMQKRANVTDFNLDKLRPECAYYAIINLNKVDEKVFNEKYFTDCIGYSKGIYGITGRVYDVYDKYTHVYLGKGYATGQATYIF